jgi:hypothetical protein
MAMKKRFYRVNGQMMGYEASGVKRDFLKDHIEPLTTKIDQTRIKKKDPSAGATEFVSDSDHVDHGGLGCL